MKKILIVFLFLFSSCFAEDFHLFTRGIYFYEKNDVEWHINFKGKIPSFCGFYFILFNVNGNCLYCDAIFSSDYSEKPFTITIPKDNITGCYKAVIVGEEAVFDSLKLPLSDLDYETYGSDYFAVHYKGRIYFQTPTDDTYVLGAYKGHLKVFNEKGEVIADTKITKKQEKYDNLTEFAGKREITYSLELECRYFKVKNGKKIFVSNDPKKIFIPDENIDKIEWWKIPLLTKEKR